VARSRLKRGDIVTAVFAGDYGKPRPNVVVQSDNLVGLESILLCPLTSDLDTSGPARVHVQATALNQLRSDSLVMVDKITAVSLARCRDRLGALQLAELEELNVALALVVGLLD
jgi:mRNA interferase MazF